ncbi:MAG: hypothetical protein Q9196_003970 [Gyalolechia fulgens]
MEDGGGFLADRGGEEAMPTAGRGSGRRILSAEESEGSDVDVPSDGEGDEEDHRRNQTPAVTVRRKHGRACYSDEDDAGGFLRDDAGGGGGFIPDDDQEHAAGCMDPDENIATPSADQAQREEELLLASADKKAEEALEEQESPPHFPPVSENLQLPRTTVALAGKPSLEEDGKSFAEDEGNEVVPVEMLLHRTLTDAELEEATMLQRLYESQPHQQPADAPPFERLPEQDAFDGGKGNGVVDVEEVAVVAAEEEERGNLEMVDEMDGDEKKGEEDEEDGVAVSEKGSLMSEDPDDEDAEPDWLV